MLRGAGCSAIIPAFTPWNIRCAIPRSKAGIPLRPLVQNTLQTNCIRNQLCISTMATQSSSGLKMRVLHRYLGFFLVGVMAVYAISGIILIFRDTDFLKRETHIVKTVQPNASATELGKLLDIRQLKVEKEEGNFIYFREGAYNKTTGQADYTLKELPYVLNRMTHLHKAKSADPLFFFNIFFGLSLFFFVISSFWMFMPGTSVFRKGLYFTIGGIVLTLILLFV